ncbi:MAG: sigma-70 family RNA polymerase sigma factor [Hyphomicrobiales bacterium]
MNSSYKKPCCNPHEVTNDFYDKVYGYVINRGFDKDKAKDITQDVMGKMMEAFTKEKEVYNLKAWLFQVTRNTISDQYRRNNSIDFKEVNEDIKVEINQQFDLSAEDFIVPMINLLPEDYREPLYLSDIKNMKQADVAKKLNLSLSAIKMRCKRGRLKLQELFNECCEIHYTESGAFAYCTIKDHCNELIDEEERLRQKH